MRAVRGVATDSPEERAPRRSPAIQSVTAIEDVSLVPSERKRDRGMPIT
jgi:hypothetical protein